MAACSLSKQTVNSIWQNRDKLRQAYESCGGSHRKRLRTSAFDDVEEAVLKWFAVARSQNLPVSGPLLREKAQEFAKLLNHDTFQCSGGWLDRFRTRHNIVFRDICGEAAAELSTVTSVIRGLQRAYLPCCHRMHRVTCLTLMRLGSFIECCLTKPCVLKATAVMAVSRARNESPLWSVQTWTGRKNYRCW